MVVVLLALIAAALSAVSAAGEHRAASGLARRRPQDSGSVVPVRAGFALALVTTPLWVASWSLDVGAFLAQAAALHLGALSVVQALMVTTLLFTLPLAAVNGRRSPTARDWVAAIVLCAGLALVLSTRGSVGGPSATPTSLFVPAVAVLTAVVVVLVLASRGRSPAVRGALLGVAAGMLFAVGAATTKLTAGVAAGEGFTALLTSWPGYALAAASVASFALQQSAYAVGPLATVMTAVVITDPLGSYLLGVVGFGERPPAAGAELLLTAAGMLGLVVGVAVLARSSLLRSAADVPAAAAAPAPAPARGIPLRSGLPDRRRRGTQVAADPARHEIEVDVVDRLLASARRPCPAGCPGQS